MPKRIEVMFAKGVTDAEGDGVRSRTGNELGIELDRVRSCHVYLFEDELKERELELLAREVFADPVSQIYSIDHPLATEFDWILEIGFRPGVTDNVGRTSRIAASYTLDAPLKGDVYSAVQYQISGDVGQDDIERIARDLLANELIQRWSIVSKEEFDPGTGMGTTLPRVTSTHRARVREFDLSGDDDELMRLSRDGVLALTLGEMKAIRDHFRKAAKSEGRRNASLGPNPTDVEMELLAQTWSEHCKHKIFNAEVHYKDATTGTSEDINSLFRTYIVGATEASGKPWLRSVFHDNAGVIALNDEWNLVMKVETHNSPSALDPYGGALTGIVGVNRDPMGTGKGARLLFNTDIFCFASPFYDGEIPPRLLHPKRVLEGVRMGVEHGGNKSGIPTVNGSVVFHERYLGKPLVYCGTGGIMPARINGTPSEQKAARPGDLIVMVGGRIGKDGIHGATFSSEELHEGSPSTAVQIGDPITQKKMYDALLEARDMGLYSAITDNGAGGLSSSVGEMAEDPGGCLIDLGKAPLKYPGLDPWEILVSEAQERMTLALPPSKIEEFLRLCERREVEASVLGTFTDSGLMIVTWGDQVVARLDMNFLHHGLTDMELEAVWDPPSLSEPGIEVGDHLTILKQLLASLNICSKEYIIRQYDHEVQGMSVVKPLTGAHNDGPSDAAVLRPLPDSEIGVVSAHGIVPRYSDIDTYHMSACAVDEAMRSHVAVGGRPDHVAALDNFCWCDPVPSAKNPDGAFKMAQLVRANRALYDVCTAYGIPLISGKDSMKNDYQNGELRISIPPTLLVSTIGRIDDVRKAVTMDVKAPEDMVYVLGKTRNELGGSELYALYDELGANVPKVHPEEAFDMYSKLHEAMEGGLVASCHDISDGGLAVALAESAFAGDLGMDIELGGVPVDGELSLLQLLYSESPSRFVVTLHPDNAVAFEGIMGEHAGRVGTVTSRKSFRLTDPGGGVCMDAPLEELKEAWQGTMRW